MMGEQVTCLALHDLCYAGVLRGEEVESWFIASPRSKEWAVAIPIQALTWLSSVKRPVLGRRETLGRRYSSSSPAWAPVNLGVNALSTLVSPPGKVTGRITGMTLPPQYVTIYSINALTDDCAGRNGTVTSDAQYTLSGLNTQTILIDFAATNQGLQRHPTPVEVTAGHTTNVDLQVN